MRDWVKKLGAVNVMGMPYAHALLCDIKVGVASSKGHFPPIASHKASIPQTII